jgi:hypothetical protein
MIGPILIAQFVVTSLRAFLEAIYQPTEWLLETSVNFVVVRTLRDVVPPFAPSQLPWQIVLFGTLQGVVVALFTYALAAWLYRGYRRSPDALPG